MPASWLEQVNPAEQKSLGGTSSSTKSTNVSKGSRMTNTNWNMSIKKCWEAANIVSLNKTLEAKDLNATVPLPKFGDTEACLSWLIKGRCFLPACVHPQAGGSSRGDSSPHSPQCLWHPHQQLTAPVAARGNPTKVSGGTLCRQIIAHTGLCADFNLLVLYSYFFILFRDASNVNSRCQPLKRNVQTILIPP